MQKAQSILQHCGIDDPRRTICIDWDGVIHSYTSGYQGDVASFPDAPVEGAIEFLTNLLSSGNWIVIIHTARTDGLNLPGIWRVEEAIFDYLHKHGLPANLAEQITVHQTRGKPRADVYLDDRAYRFEGIFPHIVDLEMLAPWNEPINVPCPVILEDDELAELEEEDVIDIAAWGFR